LDLRKWAGLELFLENRGGMIANDILELMRRRKVELFGNTVVIAAVFLDVFQHGQAFSGVRKRIFISIFQTSNQI
jgi:hypothetical protein